MKYSKMIYSDFVPNRPEQISNIEFWCLFGGFALVIFVAFDSGRGFSGDLRIETILSLFLPAAYYGLNYIACAFAKLKSLFVISILLGLGFSLKLLIFPEYPYLKLWPSDLAITLFSMVTLLIVINRKFRTGRF